MERELESINKVNILALTTYALALAGSSMSSKANARLHQKQVYNRGKYLKEALSSGDETWLVSILSTAEKFPYL